jgi:hypothetical protein
MNRPIERGIIVTVSNYIRRMDQGLRQLKARDV